jgi:WD40 repeat protein
MERKELYALVVRQLIDDGYHKAAEIVAQETHVKVTPSLPKNQLLRVFNQKIEYNAPEEDWNLEKFIEGDQVKKTNFPGYVTRYISACKDPVTCAAFSSAGDYAAIASEDCSVKILEVDKMHSHIDVKGERSGEYESTNPIYKTIYDHARVRFAFSYIELTFFYLACA